MTLNGSRRAAIAGAAIFLLTALVLWSMGRSPICACGTIKLWHGVVKSAENSQHIADWYTFSHVIHGMLFYLGGWLLFRRWSLASRFVVALALEGGWEVFENTPFIIERYREATIALDYYGDSILNSLFDMLWMALGFLAAARLPVWLTVVLALGFEAGTAYAIRDNLALNVLMLIWPIEAVKQWQGG